MKAPAAEVEERGIFVEAGKAGGPIGVDPGLGEEVEKSSQKE